MTKNITSNEKQDPTTRLLYPARLLIKMEGEVRSFPDKRRLEEHTSSKPALQDMLKGLFREKKKRKRVRERGTQLQRE